MTNDHLTNRPRTTRRTLLAVFAHPDDESFGIGGTLARYAAEGVRVVLASATRGEAGKIHDPSLGTREQLAEIRERELRCACDVLGISELHLLDYRDSGMAGSPDNDDPRALVQADPVEVVGKIVRVMRQVCPQVVVTFEEGGGYGHPDHIAIHRYTVAAFQASRDESQYPEHQAEGLEPHVPQKLYFTALPRRFFRGLAQRLKEMGLADYLAGFDWESRGVPDELCTTEIDVSAYVDIKLQAFQCHRSQLSRNGPFGLIPPEVRWDFMSTECFSLAGARLEPGQKPGADLFANT
jgi:N-acetyl-1-D-myo-inositol-2-amino-2-deoxy-alpha-D-glucopyranoside deacetylase